MIKFGEKDGNRNGKLTASAMIYQHSDGYPDGEHGVLVLLQTFFRAVEKDTRDTRFEDPEYLAAKFLVWATQAQRAREVEWRKTWPASMRDAPDGPLNFLGHGVSLREHGDIAYCYFVDCSRHNEQGRPLVLVRGRDGRKYKLGKLDMQAKLAVEALDAPPVLAEVSNPDEERVKAEYDEMGRG